MMQKKVLVLAVAAAIAAPVAFADTGNVTIYGLAHMAFQGTDNGSAGTNKVSSETSKFGFKGSEDLGNGLSAIWQIEQSVAMDAGGSTLGTRNTFAGLKSDSMGTFLMGLYDTPYKISTRKLDVFGDTIADNRSLMGGDNGNAGMSFDKRQGNVIAYTSPSMNGLSTSLAYVAGAENAANPTDTKGSAWSLAAMYDAAPFYGALAYETHTLGTTGTGTLVGASNVAGAFKTAGSKESSWKLGLGYTMDALQLNLAYEKTSDNFGGAGATSTLVTGLGNCTSVGADCFGHSAYYLSGKYSFGSDAVKFAYSSAGKLAGQTAGTDTSAKQITLGYDHSLSKRTTVYALYTKVTNAADVAYGLSTAGSTGGMAAAGKGFDPSAWSLGIKHSF